MRAVALSSAESTSPELVDLPLPEPQAGEVRVKVAAASVNGFDLSVAAGHTKAFMEHRYPLVLGKDFAGIVDAVGPEASGYAIGDRVFGTVTKDFLGDGSFAEYVTVPVQVGITHLPEAVSFVDGAALGLAGAAAHAAVDAGRVDADTSVLVVGATGGVGVQVVQLMAAAGAAVAGTSGTKAEAELLRSLGATAVIDRNGHVVESRPARCSRTGQMSSSTWPVTRRSSPPHATAERLCRRGCTTPRRSRAAPLPWLR